MQGNLMVPLRISLLPQHSNKFTVFIVKKEALKDNMANNNDKPNASSAIHRIDKRLDNMQSNMDQLYQSTYNSRMDDKRDMEGIVDSIDNTMDSIISKINNKKVTDISSLYLRIQNKETGTQTDLSKSLDSLFDDNHNLLDSINVDTIRKSIQAEDYEYDLICRYMPKLLDALEIKKDNVLSADNFTKDFINVVTDKSNKDSIKQFDDRIDSIKKRYKVQDFFEKTYMNTSKYGEDFIYHVPYKTAFDRLLKRKRSMQSSGIGMRSESCIFEATEYKPSTDSPIELNEELLKEMQDNDVKVNLFIDESRIIPEPIAALKEAFDAKQNNMSLTESYLVEANNNGTITVGAPLKYDDNTVLKGSHSSEGLFDATGKSMEVSKKITGSVIYRIPRQDIFPVVIGETVIGYIYVNVINNYIENMVMNGYTYNSLTNNTRLMSDEFDKQNDIFVNYVAGMISDKIDAKFINANIDLKKEIFSILRYNDKFSTTNGVNNITVSFLLYLNTVIGMLYRGQDKRVYYVKKNVEQNVERTLLNVVNQLKKGNMGMRQLENMNTIFNVIGKYNDHIIPMSQNGDTPITMDVLQGQNIETPNDLMDRMEDQAVNSTDVPLEFVNSTNNVDYATRFTMSNSKFLRKVYKRSE